MQKTLIIGYGNADREDDGAAWHVLAGIAQRLGRPAPGALEDGFYPQDEEVDLWYDLQLLPEMAEDFARYARILFVDAHTGSIPEEIHLQQVEGSPATSSFTHHMTPAAALAITNSIYQKMPEAALLSVRGYRFGFTRQLSERTSELVAQAVDTAWNWIQQGA